VNILKSFAILVVAGYWLIDGALYATGQNEKLADCWSSNRFVLYDRSHIACIGTLAGISATNMTAEFESEIYHVCLATQTVDSLLFLGLGTSQMSRVLLEGAATNADCSIAEAAQLALARRGDAGCERVLLRHFYARPESTNVLHLLCVDAREAREVLASLHYVGSAECWAALFDMALLSGEDHIRTADGVKKISTPRGEDIKWFMDAVGISIPDGISSGIEIVFWWRNNRETILKELKGKDARFFPRRRPFYRMLISCNSLPQTQAWGAVGVRGCRVPCIGCG
jgi:hypothetical protein